MLFRSEDADIALAVKAAGGAKFRNAGQVCISPTRFLVHESICRDFAAALVRHAQGLKVGDGLGEGVQMGLRGQRLQRVPLTRGQPTLDDGLPLFTGDVIVPNLGWDRSGRIRLVHDEPLPCTVLFLGGDLEIGD